METIDTNKAVDLYMDAAEIVLVRHINEYSLALSFSKLSNSKMYFIWAEIV